ncbi:lysophospholipase L1-like esterase [Hoeflea sp. IMCC20628]|nr:lysophospholipase L1-like esterase [Hoeflea sp. IMCC20628]
MQFKGLTHAIAGLAAALFLTLGMVSMPERAFAEAPLKLVGFGDSLMAGYQLQGDQGFPAQLQAALQQRGHDVEIIDAGVSGDTTSGGLARLDWSIPDGVDGVILELGANDALRGLPPETSRENLEAMISRLKERGIPVLLAGMLAPPNLGTDYETAFNAIYPELASEHELLLYPFFLDGVTGNSALQLPDGMHPNASGINKMVENILPVAEQFIEQIKNP